jgi:hypothetical protein
MRRGKDNVNTDFSNIYDCSKQYGQDAFKLFMIEAIRINPECMQYVDNITKQDEALVKFTIAITANKSDFKLFSTNAQRDDKDFMLSAILLDDSPECHVFFAASDRLKNGKDFLPDVLSRSSLLRAKKAFDLEKLKKGELEFKDSELMRMCKDAALIAIKNKGGLELKHASENLKDDEDVVLMAIHSNQDALNYSSKRLQRDKDFILRAIALNEDVVKMDCILDQFNTSWSKFKLSAEVNAAKKKAISLKIKKAEKVKMKDNDNPTVELVYLDGFDANKDGYDYENIKNDQAKIVGVAFPPASAAA